jgi:hypothetical protein
MAGGRRTDRARVTCPYWCGPRACGHAAASRNAVGRCAPDNRARTIAPWSCLAVPYRSTSGSLTALHPSELTGGRSAVLPRRTAAGYRCGRAAVRGGRVTGVGRFWMERAHADQPGPWSAMGSIAYPFRPSPQTTRPGNQSRRRAVSSCRSRSMISWRHAPGRRARPLAARQLIPAPVDEPEQIVLGLVHVNARDRSRVGRQLALRPGFSALARMPPTALRAPRGERPGLLVLTAGPVPYFYGRYPTGPGAIARLGEPPALSWMT